MHVKLETFLSDVRYALRTLVQTPAFSLTALAALTLGIGLNTAIFSVVNTVLLRPLTYPDSDRIVFFYVTTPAGPSWGGSAAKFNAWRRQTQLFQDVTAYEYSGASLNLTGGAYPEQVRAIRVSADYFRLFGAPIVQGRGFIADEDRPGGSRAAVISYSLWQRRFDSDPHIVGNSISLGGTSYSVVGIVGAGFDTELDTHPDVWLPFQIDPSSSDHATYFTIAGRLRPGITFAAATAGLQPSAEEFHRQYPNIVGAHDGFGIQPFAQGLVGDEWRTSLLVFAGAVSFVLLIACANVANLLLARATSRQREITLRAALGAGRGRIIRQLLTESLVLSAIGGACGLAFGFIGVRLLLRLYPGGIPRIGEHGGAIALDWRLTLFTISVTALTGILFGLIPALHVSRADLNSTLKEGGGRSGTSLSQHRSSAILVISEVALALVLLIGAGLLIRTFVALRHVELGFNARNVVTMRMPLAGSRFHKTSDVNQLIRDATRRVEAIPGVAVAAASYNLPLEGAFGIPFNIAGRDAAAGRYDGRGWIGISPGYFDAFKIPLLRGRVFSERDDAGAPRVAIINQVLAHQFWPQGNPLEGRLVLGRGYGDGFDEPERTIIGVVGDVHDFRLNHAPSPVVYVPMAQVTDGITAVAARASSLAWIVRTNVAPRSVLPAIQSELQQAIGTLQLTQVRSMDEVITQSTAGADFNMFLLTLFGCSALLLAAIGIYGLMAYSVRQRTREIGIRVALGAEPGQVRNMILWHGMRLALAGIAIGLAAAFALTRVMASALFGVAAIDPVAFTAVPILLAAVALFAVWLPALRATGVDPVRALRSE